MTIHKVLPVSGGEGSFALFADNDVRDLVCLGSDLVFSSDLQFNDKERVEATALQHVQDSKIYQTPGGGGWFWYAASGDRLGVYLRVTEDPVVNGPISAPYLDSPLTDYSGISVGINSIMKAVVFLCRDYLVVSTPWGPSGRALWQIVNVPGLISTDRELLVAFNQDTMTISIYPEDVTVSVPSANFVEALPEGLFFAVDNNVITTVDLQDYALGNIFELQNTVKSQSVVHALSRPVVAQWAWQDYFSTNTDSYLILEKPIDSVIHNGAYSVPLKVENVWRVGNNTLAPRDFLLIRDSAVSLSLDGSFEEASISGESSGAFGVESAFQPVSRGGFVSSEIRLYGVDHNLSDPGRLHSGDYVNADYRSVVLDITNITGSGDLRIGPVVLEFSPIASEVSKLRVGDDVFIAPAKVNVFMYKDAVLEITINGRLVYSGQPSTPLLQAFGDFEFSLLLVRFLPETQYKVYTNGFKRYGRIVWEV